MNYKLEKVKLEEKEILYNLLQFALYDGSQYIENELNENGKFEYHWFDNYFTDENRLAYFIKSEDNKILGFFMINENMKYYNEGHSVAEFLILPNYRRNHIGKRVAFDIFNMLKGNWEVEPIENSDEAYYFWKKTIEDYTDNNCEYKNKIFVFKN